MTATSRPLDLVEAVDLAAAWVVGIAEQRGIRVLIVKGPTLSHFGLRQPRASSDVDVLIDPTRLDEMCAAITAGGWEQRPQTEVGAVTASHSRTYFRASWPSDIDAHSHFPGFLADSSDVFEQLWAERELMYLGHKAVPIPSRNACLLIAALHQLRDGRGRTDHTEMRTVVSTELSEADRRQLIVLATQTGALDPLRDVLVALGISPSDLPTQVETTELRAWRSRIEADSSGAYFWILLIQLTTPAKRVGVVARALWPPRRDLLINNPATDDTFTGRTLARLARFPRGLRGLRQALRALRIRYRGALPNRPRK